MPPDSRFIVPRRSAPRPTTSSPHWVGEFLASRGSGNATLAAGLARTRALVARAAVVAARAPRAARGCRRRRALPDRRRRVGDRCQRDGGEHRGGWEPAPLLAQFDRGRLLLQDGNHRYEALDARGRDRTRGCSSGSTIPTSIASSEIGCAPSSPEEAAMARDPAPLLPLAPERGAAVPRCPRRPRRRRHVRAAAAGLRNVSPPRATRCARPISSSARAGPRPPASWS